MRMYMHFYAALIIFLMILIQLARPEEPPPSAYHQDPVWSIKPVFYSNTIYLTYVTKYRLKISLE